MSQRVYDGFTELSGGMDANSSPSLLQPNQSAFLGNISLRGDFAGTRPPFRQKILDFENARTQTNWAGVFQGACFYDALDDETQNSLIVSINGLTFRIFLAQNFLVEDITPGPAELVTSDFVVPALHGSVTIDVTSETAFTVGNVVKIDGGSYTITALGADQLTVTYNGGALNTGWIVTAATVITDNSLNPIYASVAETVLTTFIVPAPAAQVTISVPSSTPFTMSENIIMDGGSYTVGTLGTGFIICTYNSGALHSTVGSTTPILDNTSAPITYQLLETAIYDFTVPALNLTVTITVPDYSAFTVNQQIIIGGEHFTVTAKPAPGEITIKFTGGDYHGIIGIAITDTSSNQIYFTDTNPPDVLMTYWYQGENYAFGLCENQGTLIFDGSSLRRADQSQSELPSSYVGVYAWGRNWLAQVNGHRFVAGDLVGDPSGSPGRVYVDAILKMTENDLLNGGGAFSIPANLGMITAMGVLSQLDSSLGIGPVLVGTVNSIFSVQAPVDRTTWQNLTYPIQSVALQGSGPVGPRSMISVNSDSWFRSLDGIRSLMAARRDFQSNLSNTPQSEELSPVFSADNESLLFYNSIIPFDNRIFTTISPYWTAYGIAHKGLAVVNLDTLSGMSSKNPPVWEGIWTGLNVLQILSGNIDGTLHCYAFVLNASNGIDLWEFVPEANKETFDLNDTVSGGVETLTSVPIQSWVETRSMNFGDPFQLKKLIMGELYLDQISDNVSVKIYFMPDQYPAWMPWTTEPICANVSQCSLDGTTCSVFQPKQNQYTARLTIPRPPETCNTITGKPIDRGYEFQFRFEITGSCRVRKFKAHAVIEQDSKEGECPPDSATCKTTSGCPPQWFTYNAYGI
jgi:hypothetical protein